MAKSKGKSGKSASNGPKPEDSESPREAAYFLSLSLENVRCFGPKQTLDLSDGNGKPARWTIILGVNGTGKTTLLQCLVGFNAASKQYSKTIEIESCHFLIAGTDYWSSLRRYDPAHQPTIEAILSSSSNILIPSVVVEPARFKLLNGHTCQYYLSARFAPYVKSIAYGAGRRVGTVSLSESASDDPTATLFSDKAELRNPEEWLLRLDYAAKSAANDDRNAQEQRLEQAKELLLSILPDVDDIRLVSSSGPNPQPRVEFRTPYGWVPLRQLGYGYQTLITWVADLVNRLAERYPDSPNPLAEPAVVLVDEIDLHLHPKWQRKLMGFLTERFPNTQFIATAHSPLIAQAAADANLVVLRQNGDHVLIDNDVQNITNWRIDQILTSDLFGLETARPPQIEEKLAKRKELLSQSKLSSADQKQLKTLEEEIGDLPFGETDAERNERKMIRETLDRLMREREQKP